MTPTRDRERRGSRGRDRCICHGVPDPMDVPPTPGSLDHAGRLWRRGQSETMSKKHLRGEPPRSQRAASKSLCRSPLLLAALGGLSCQLSTRQPREAAGRHERRGCRSRWPQPPSTSGTAVALVVEPVNMAEWRAVASTSATWPRRTGQRHRLRRPLACPCCTTRAYLVGLSVDIGANGEGCVARAARSSDPARVDRPSS